MEETFGWDKIFDEHGITNPKLFGPIYDCEDTGERLEMVIAVDTTENRVGVPDGGQKGVITMYPLPGGDGVVEVQPNWTMALPRVSGNVPIN